MSPNATGHQYKMLKISPNEERLKGYDAEIVGMTSFYRQFKTSDLLSKGALYKKRCRIFAPLLAGPRPPSTASLKSSLQTILTTRRGRSVGSITFFTRFGGLTEVELRMSRHCSIRVPRWRSMSERTEGVAFCNPGYLCAGGTASSVTIEAGMVNGHMRCRLPIFIA